MGNWFRLVLLVICFSYVLAARAEDALPFDVNLVVLSKRPEALQRATPEQLKREVEILNTYFVAANGERPAKFRLKGYSYAHELGDSSCQNLLAMGDRSDEYDHVRFKEYYDGCRDSRVVDPRAINFYVYDSYRADKGFADNTSHGHYHGGRPFIVIDWERLDHRIQSPEEHEMGHAFGLGHVCEVGATLKTSTNIMASHDCGKGSGGRRDKGFDERQMGIIKEKARKVWIRFNNP